MGSRAIRKKLWLAALFAVLVLVFRPGVRETLIRAVESTIQTDSLKGKSYEYRWKLWNVAFSEISKSPERTLFGYGGLSTEKMDLGHYFQAESGGTTGALGYTSWDNQFACNLIEFGFVGFLIEFTLMIAVLLKLFSNWWRCRGPDRGLLLAFLSSCTIYVYALSNVYIFSPQLKCLFWALVACGLRFGADALRQDRDPTGVRKTANDRGRRRSVPHSGTPSFA